MKELEATPGSHIDEVCKQAVAEAAEFNEPVHFEFNGVSVVANPGDVVGELSAKWSADMKATHEAYISSPEYKERQERDEKELREKMAAHMTESATDEKSMREAEVPWPLTKEQLIEYVESLVSRSHDYGTCVYAMSMAAEAAFNYVSGKLGVTGFQASCADLDFLRRTRGMKGPFLLIKAEDALYPQYDLPRKLTEAMEGWKPWLKEQAEKNIAEKDSFVHPDVLAHWKKLAEA